MNTSPQLGLKRVKAVALAVRDLPRAQKFYGETLGLAPVSEGSDVGFQLGDSILLLKANWYGNPTAEPNPRITIQCESARATEAALRERDVTISDAVERYEGLYYVGAFLDSEGNKLWFCSPE